MKALYLVSVILLHLNWCFGLPNPRGVAAFSYQDTAGNRYGGTYDLDDKNIVRNSDPYFDQFSNVAQLPYMNNFADAFFPNYVSNYDNILQEVFASNLKAQRLALYAAQRAYDITANQFREFPHFYRFPSYGASNFFGGDDIASFDMSQPNSAFASGSVGPGFSHQIAAINPESDAMRNIDVSNRFNDSPGPKFYSVSSSSFSSSSNNNGKAKNMRGAETVVNNNGKITKYRVES